MKDESYTSEDTEGMTTRHEEQADSTREAPADTTRAQEETGSTRHYEEETGSARRAESSPEAPATGYPTLEDYDDWLFEVEGTALKKYYGEGPVVQIPYGVTEIGKSAFSNCDSLKGITIPASVMSIGDWVFWGCDSLQEITIPASVTSIGGDAFYGCSALTIYCEAKKQPEGWDANWNCSNRPVVWDKK